MILLVYLSSTGFFLRSYIKVLMQLPWRNKNNHNILRVFIYSSSYVLFNPLSKQDAREREKAIQTQIPIFHNETCELELTRRVPKVAQQKGLSLSTSIIHMMHHLT